MSKFRQFRNVTVARKNKGATVRRNNVSVVLAVRETLSQKTVQVNKQDSWAGKKRNQEWVVDGQKLLREKELG